MKRSSIETMVGLFMVIGIVCVGYLTIKLGKMDFFNKDSYVLEARFQSVTGLKSGARIEMSGVEIGKVEKISLDQEKQAALVQLRINRSIILTEDVIASVRTAGLIGEKYIKLEAGGSDVELKSGDVIIETESALDIEELISKYVFGEV